MGRKPKSLEIILGETQIQVSGLIFNQIIQIDHFNLMIDSHLPEYPKAISFKTSLSKYRLKLKERADAILSSSLEVLIEIGEELLEINQKYQNYFIKHIVPEWVRLEPENKDVIFKAFKMKT